jgi:hypothetical protein
MNLKKLIALTLMTALCLTTTLARADTLTTPGQASTSAVINSDATLFSITVPTSVLLYKNSAGDVITPDNLAITNNSVGPIQVTSLVVQTEGGWTLDPANTDYSKFKIGHKNFIMTFNGKDPAAGDVAFDTPINGGDSLKLALAADVAPQKDAINIVNIGSIVVMFGWYTGASNNPVVPVAPPVGSYPAGYVLATDADFTGSTDGDFKYTGSAEYVVIPDKIKGIPLTSYRDMFSSTAVKGVISHNSNITSMQGMFNGATAIPIELDLNTSNVTDCSNMFAGTNTTVLDLSTFDLAKATVLSNMFDNALATTGYARTPADADKLNASAGKPAGLTFTVK